MDVQNIFLNGDLSKEVYMQPPPSLYVESNKDCHLRRVLYVLNKFHKLGLPNLVLPSLMWVTWLVIIILPYLFIALTKVLFYFSCMWMI